MERTEPPARPAGWRRILFRLPIQVYRARLGWLLAKRFVLLHHVGRKTGAARQAVVEVVQLGEGGAITVASGFGKKSDWYLNVLAHPQIEVELGSRRMQVQASPLTPDQAAAAMADYGRRHPRAGKELCGYMGMKVDGSEAEFREAGRGIPMLLLDPVR